MNPLVTPAVNMNGSPAKRLVEELVGVLNALDAAVDAMRAATPNGRDFQTLPNGFEATNSAVDAWRERIGMLIALKDEITNHALAIQVQDR